MSTPFSAVDRMLHKRAFSRMGLQDMMIDVAKSSLPARGLKPG